MWATRLLKFFEESVRDANGKVSGKRLTAMTATGCVIAMVTGLFFNITAPDAAWWAITGLAGTTAGASVFERRMNP